MRRKALTMAGSVLLQVGVVLAMLLCADSASAAVAGLDGLVAKIQEFNAWLITLGGALAVTGFIRVCLALLVGLGNAASAAVMLGGGLAIAAAPQIGGFFVGA